MRYDVQKKHIRKSTPEKSEHEKAQEGLGQVTRTLDNTEGCESRSFDKETRG